MKIANILLAGVGIVVIYKIGKHISRKHNEPVLVKYNGSLPAKETAKLLVVAPGSVIGTSETGAEVKILSGSPADRSIFPSNIYERFETKDGGETARTYIAAE